MRVDGLWIGQVAMAALMNVAFAFAVGSALLGAWLANDAQAKIAPARPAWLRAQRSMQAASIVLVRTSLQGREARWSWPSLPAAGPLPSTEDR